MSANESAASVSLAEGLMYISLQQARDADLYVWVPVSAASCSILSGT